MTMKACWPSGSIHDQGAGRHGDLVARLRDLLQVLGGATLEQVYVAQVLEMCLLARHTAQRSPLVNMRTTRAYPRGPWNVWRRGASSPPNPVTPLGYGGRASSTEPLAAPGGPNNQHFLEARMAACTYSLTIPPWLRVTTDLNVALTTWSSSQRMVIGLAADFADSGEWMATTAVSAADWIVGVVDIEVGTAREWIRGRLPAARAAGPDRRPVRGRRVVLQQGAHPVVGGDTRERRAPGGDRQGRARGPPAAGHCRRLHRHSTDPPARAAPASNSARSPGGTNPTAWSLSPLACRRWWRGN